MADILIKNMEMPKNCNYCPMYDDEYCQCRLEPSYDGHWTRANGCPLVELPPHGRLGDLDEVERRMRVGRYNPMERNKSAYDYIRDAPTIVEANNG